MIVANNDSNNTIHSIFTMNNYLVLFAAIFTFSLCKGQEIECLIIHGKGLETIKVGESLLEDVTVLYGGKIKEREVFGCGYFGEESCGKAKYLRYKKLGLDFCTLPRAKYTKIDRIMLDKKCKCQTIEGVRAGESTGAEVIAAYGDPKSLSMTEEGTFLYYAGTTYILKKSPNIMDSEIALKEKIKFIQIKARKKKKKSN